jgi:hypothetical protein
MTGRTHTLPWWLGVGGGGGGELVKATENKMHWPRCPTRTDKEREMEFVEGIG